MKKRMALLLASNRWASYHIFTGSITEYLKKIFDVDIFTEENLHTLHIDCYDIIYMNKNSSIAAVSIAVTADVKKIPLVYETDDNFLSASVTKAGVAHSCDQDVQKNLMCILSVAKAVLVYSKQSRIDFLKYNDNVTILPVYQNVYTDEPPIGRSEKTIIGFMGGSLKDLNFTWVLPALRELSRMHPHIYFEFLGFLPQGAETLPNVIYSTNHIRYDQFIQSFIRKKWTIGIAPLADVAFNNSKTNVKYREYAAAGYPGVYSNVEPYSSTIINRESGLLANNTTEEWVSAINELLHDEDLRISILKKSWYDIKENYSFKYYCKTKISILKSIAEDCSPLNMKNVIGSVMSGRSAQGIKEV